MKKIYISGQITGLIKSEYEKNFNDSKLWIYKNVYYWESYKNIINPLDLNPFLGIKSWLCYMIIDIHHLRKCTHIAMQSNWVDSKGATIEYYFAKFIFKLQIIWL